MSLRITSFIAAGAVLLAGAVGGAIVVVTSASRAGLPAPPIHVLAVAALVGLGCAVPVAALCAWLVVRRPVHRVLSPILFPALGLCVFLGPYGNHALTGAAVLVSVVLATIAILFFMRTSEPTGGNEIACPTCGKSVPVGTRRCPHCATLISGA